MMIDNSDINSAVAWTVAIGLLVCATSTGAHGQQQVPRDATAMTHTLIDGGKISRLGNRLYVLPDKDSSAKTVTLPRLAASLRSAEWSSATEEHPLALKVEQEHWILTWNTRPSPDAIIVLSFDFPPEPMTAIKPIEPSGDGSLYLPACMATTVGEKVRYEPQTFKNTVGYWTGKQDFATWEFDLDRPGSFNVAVLQGCGASQGGSQARISVMREGPTPIANIDFEVLETGHFQNFQWRHLGQVELNQAGVHKLKIEPLNILKAALMDVRAVHLVRLPDRKK